MTRRDKFRNLIWIGLAVILTLLISSSLARLVLRPGEPFSLGEAAPAPVEDGGFLPGGGSFLLLFRGLLALALILMPLYIFINLFTREGRQRLLGDLILFLLIFAGLGLLSRIPRQALTQPASPTSQAGPILPDGTSEPTVTFNPQVSSWLVPAVVAGLALLVAGVGTYAIWIYSQRMHPSIEPRPLDRLAGMAQDAVDAIQSGLDFKDTVMRCYFQMSQVLLEERGVERKDAMTPREFEKFLAETGLPAEPVRRLTRLFEEVRYGRERPGKAEERLAIDSLEAIVNACRNNVYAGRV